MVDNTNFIPFLKEKYPEIFNGWDGYEVSIKARNRIDEKPLIVVVLYNKAKRNMPRQVSLYSCFQLTIDDKENDVIKVGGIEILQDYDDAYLPKKFRDKLSKK